MAKGTRTKMNFWIKIPGLFAAVALAGLFSPGGGRCWAMEEEGETSVDQAGGNGENYWVEPAPPADPTAFSNPAATMKNQTPAPASVPSANPPVQQPKSAFTTPSHTSWYWYLEKQ